MSGSLVTERRRRIRTRIERERENVDSLGDDYRFTRDPALAAERAARRRARRLSAPPVRIVKCAIRGCRSDVFGEGLQVCTSHAVDIWELVERSDEDPIMLTALGSEFQRREAIRAERRAKERRVRTQPDAAGQIYYAKVGDLIKVGWSSDLRKRMRAYGPEAELLAHYPATRLDETNLHRQLKPSRAKGREWYYDDDIVRAFIYRATREHGAPKFTHVHWTEAQKQQVKVKSWRG